MCAFVYGEAALDGERGVAVWVLALIELPGIVRVQMGQKLVVRVELARTSVVRALVEIIGVTTTTFSCSGGFSVWAFDGHRFAAVSSNVRDQC